MAFGTLQTADTGNTLTPIKTEDRRVFEELASATEAFDRMRGVTTNSMFKVACGLFTLWISFACVALVIDWRALVALCVCSLLWSAVMEDASDDHYPQILNSRMNLEGIATLLVTFLGVPLLVSWELVKIFRGNHLRPPKNSPLTDPRRAIIKDTRELVESWNNQLRSFEDIALAAKHNQGDARSVIDELRTQLVNDRAIADSRLAFMQELFEQHPLGTVTGEIKIDDAILRLEAAKEDMRSHDVNLKARIAAAKETSAIRSR
ncbi:MAG: hypothetical protein NUV56_04635 [Candidatus Uhrbacteria bacterium]|nr:hypothetical protein [Candidatus Uhrbacteria bacterium]